MKNSLDISVLIHGPFSDNAYTEIFESLKKVKEDLSEIVISTYIDVKEETEEALQKYQSEFRIKYVYNKDLINPGYFNLNRQILTVRSGLSLISDDSFVIKLRNDQWCNMSKLIRIIKKTYGTSSEQRIMSTNCFTRQDRLYHPSDMFLCGWKKSLEAYYSIPLQKNTHVGTQLEMLKKLECSNEEFKLFLISPESELFKHYLTLKDWDFEYTEQDSYDALKKYIYLINTWDIDLRWNKKRNACLPAKTIILPYSFTLEPFAGAPKEVARCYARHHFEGHQTLRDRWFIFFARVVFSIKYNKIHRFLVKVKNKLPYSVKEALKETRLGIFLRELVK